jgi:hypothetical protein
METVEDSTGHEASRKDMTMRPRNKQRRDTTPEREALRAVIHECEAFIHWADWSPLTEKSHRSITQMMGIIKGVALKALRKKRA